MQNGVRSLPSKLDWAPIAPLADDHAGRQEVKGQRAAPAKTGGHALIGVGFPETARALYAVGPDVPQQGRADGKAARDRMESRIERLCIERGLKMTGQRRVVARVLSEAGGPPAREEL